MKISVVIPAWNEAETIADAVASARAIGDEVIVVDAGSPDGTAERATSAGARVVASEKGRGHQLRAGAERASGDVLLFLHADVRLEGDARSAIARALEHPAAVAGNFFLRFEGATFAAWLFTVANDVRRRLLRIYYGDSAIFVRASTYVALGGFRAMPLFEDYDFVRRLERLGPTAYVRDVVAVASARRFEHAPLRTLLLWSLLQVLFSIGVSPARLARLYVDARPKPRAPRRGR
ncbi:MAG: TIGR04283 family arsenosugar biosynthesis glycosyltransferase [Deltaproteobacteria bacterium]|nr:TIGR04283 family arsenosugar biosynthesis glycosyltransferase [Deltaproteobacteria bacterium]